MPVKTVRFKVLSDSTQAKADLTNIDSRLELLNHKTAVARTDVNSSEGKAKLIDIQLRLERLNVMKASATLTLAGSEKINAQLLRTDAELNALSHKVVKIQIDTDSPHLPAGAQGKGGLLGLFNVVTTGGLSGAVGEMTTFEKVMLGINFATGVGEPLMAGLTVAAAGLGAGLVAAGAGAGVFGLVAKGAISAVTPAITKYTTAQAAAAIATTKTAKAAAALGEKNAFSGLTASQKALAFSIMGARTEWQNFIKAATPGVSSVIAQGIGLIPKALALMKPFLVPVETALHGIITEMGKGMNSAGLTSFISMLAKNTGPMLTDLVKAIANIGKGFGGILTAFMPVTHGVFGGIDSMTAKFAHWGQTLTQDSGFERLMDMFKADTPTVVGILKQLGGIVHTVASQLASMDAISNSKLLLTAVLPLITLVAEFLKANPEIITFVLYLKLASDTAEKAKLAFLSLRSGVEGVKTGVQNLSNLRGGFKDTETAASEASGAWGTAGGKLSNLGGTVKTLALRMGLLKVATEEGAVAQEGMDVALDANPIGIIVLAIGVLVGVIVLLATKTHIFGNFWHDVWRDIKNWGMDAWHFIDNDLIHPIMRAFDSVVSFIGAHWRLLAVILGTILLGPIAGIVIYVATHWAQIKALTSRFVGDIHGILNWFGNLPSMFHSWWEMGLTAIRTATVDYINFVRAIPGRIINAFGNIGRLLYNSGANLIIGLKNGAESIIGTIGSWIAGIGNSIVHAVKKFFHIKSPSGTFMWLGQMMMKGLVLGMIGGSSGLVDKVFGGMLGGLEGVLSKGLMKVSSLPANLLGRVFKSIGSSTSGLFKDLLGALGLGGGGGAGIGGNVVSWIKSAMAITGAPSSWLGPLETLVSKESGGNPNAVNPITVLGQHASGLFQTLPSTYAAHALIPGGVFNPIADAVAGIRYIMAEYGSPFNIPGLLGGTYRGYDAGGLLMPGLTHAYNATGAPELIIPLAGQGKPTFGSGNGGGNIYIYVQGDSDPDGAARQIHQKLRDYRRHKGGQPLGLG